VALVLVVITAQLLQKPLFHALLTHSTLMSKRMRLEIVEPVQ
jgi:hypothetical protein